MADQQYICGVNLKSVSRDSIPAGQPFLATDLHDFTFRKLQAQNLIVLHGETIEVKTPGGKKVTGPDNSTPMAAVHPPAGNKKALAVIEAEKRDRIKIKLKDLGVPFAHNTGLEKLVKKLAAKVAELEEAATAPTKPAKPKSTVAKVWDFDPAVLKELPQEQLVAKYIERCKEFNKKLKKFDDMKLLISEMSSEFGK